jgi:hypothetical protein
MGSMNFFGSLVSIDAAPEQEAATVGHFPQAATNQIIRRYVAL